MDFMKKINSEVSKMSKMVKDKANNVSMDAKIFEQEKKIKDLSNEIGKLIVAEMDKGGTFSEEVTEKYNAILKIREEIDTLNEKKVKEEKKDVICPNCNCKVEDGMSFCGKCGTKIEVKVEEVESETESDNSADSE